MYCGVPKSWPKVFKQLRKTPSKIRVAAFPEQPLSSSFQCLAYFYVNFNLEGISELFSTITSMLRQVHHYICSNCVLQRRPKLCLCKHFRYQKFNIQIRLVLWNNKTFLTIFGGDFLRSTEDTIPNIAPDASQPRQLHPIRSVPFKPHYDHA